MIATGAEYRRPPCKNLLRFEGTGYIMVRLLWKHSYVAEKR